MVTVSEKVRKQLKKPLGKLYKDFKEIKKLSKDHRIIAIGDICTLGMLAMGIKPHLAVFDFKFMRKKLDPNMENVLRMHYEKPKKFKNPAGTLSEKLLGNAEKLIKKGGGVLIEGEEDLVALAFILKAGKKDVIVYGQPHAGLVVVKPDKKLKKKIEKWLAPASLAHKVKGDKGKKA
ncbi:DUF359 domain-containing protein [Candidatus Micrarchaeota archaeon]|nr:DUF359 domain-containing protein [Candidatus Micrarchaeota archaeon]